MQSAFPSGLDKLVAEITASSWTTCYNLYLAHPALCCCFSLLLGAVSLTQTVLCLCCPFLWAWCLAQDWSLPYTFALILSSLYSWRVQGQEWNENGRNIAVLVTLSSHVWFGDEETQAIGMVVLLFWCGACRKYGLTAALRVSYLFLGPRCCHLCTSKPLLCTMWVSVAPQVVWFWFTFCLNAIFTYSMVLWFWLR